MLTMTHHRSNNTDSNNNNTKNHQQQQQQHQNHDHHHHHHHQCQHLVGFTPRHLLGMLICGDGDVYTGHFEADLYHGDGVLALKNGEMAVGGGVGLEVGVEVGVGLELGVEVEGEG